MPYAFTWPSTAFPQLPNASSHACTMAEMRELSEYAAVRGVHIIGEIDVPGHASAFMRAALELFAFPSTIKGGKSSVGIVNITSPQVIELN